MAKNVQVATSRLMTPDFQALADKLQQANLPCLRQLVSITPVKHGLSHASLLVTVWQNTPERAAPKQTPYYVKHLTNHLTSAALQRQCAVLAAAKGLSPAIIADSDDWIVCEFVDGETLLDTPDSTGDKLTRCLQLMAKWHASGMRLPELDMQARITELAGLLTLDPSQQHIIDEIRAKLAQQTTTRDLVPCHGDINFSNVLVATCATGANSAKSAAAASYLIDYEYACQAEPEYDIAMLLAVNQVGDVGLETLLEQYQALCLGDTALSAQRVKRYLAFAYLVNGLWYLQRRQSSADDKLTSLAKAQFECFDQIAWFAKPLATKMR